jgi:polysaccharide biosynthesis/export protein
MDKSLLLTGMVLAAFAPLAQAEPPVSSDAPEAPAAVATPRTPDILDDKHRFQVGEQLLFRVVEDRDPSVSLQVMDSGDVLVPYIGRVKASGKTSRELAADIKVLLEKDYYYQASVIISLNEAGSGARGSVFVSGEVTRPGTVQIPKERRLMVSEAIIAAGGFQQFADQRKVRIIRKKIGTAPGGGQATEELIVDVKAVLDEGKVARDMELQPEDRIVVRAKMINF